MKSNSDLFQAPTLQPRAFDEDSVCPKGAILALFYSITPEVLVPVSADIGCTPFLSTVSSCLPFLSAIPPQIIHQPVRAYPIRPPQEPPVFVLGEKAGQKIYPMGHPQHHGHGHPHAHMGHPGQHMGHPGHPLDRQQALMAVGSQNAAMESALRREKERAVRPHFIIFLLNLVKTTVIYHSDKAVRSQRMIVELEVRFFPLFLPHLRI